MKKILSILLMCFVSMSAYSVTMCAQDDAVIIPTNVELQNYWPTSGNSGSTWTITSSFGNIMGVSACLNVAGTGRAVDATIVADGGEQAGQYCWCKMLHPFVSYWGYSDQCYWYRANIGNTCSNKINNASNCVANCAYYCANNIVWIGTFKDALINSAL